MRSKTGRDVSVEVLNKGLEVLGYFLGQWGMYIECSLHLKISAQTAERTMVLYEARREHFNFPLSLAI